jgi:hypothetical protein
LRLAATAGRQPDALQIIAYALIGALALEAIRLAKVAELRMAVAKADDRAVVKVMLNDVKIGEVPEPLFANMKLVTANNARNYVTQFCTILRAVSWQTVLTFSR